MNKAALIASFLFHPVLLPTVIIAYIFSLDTYISQTIYTPRQQFIVAWVFFNTALLPILFTAFLRWRNLIDSIQLHLQKDRLIPFAFTLALYIINYYLLRGIPLPQVLYSIFLGSTIAVALAFLLTFYTKISIHMIGMGALSATVYSMAGIYGQPALAVVMACILLSGIVGSARILLGSHDFRQLIAGWIAGFASTLLPILYQWG